MRRFTLSLALTLLATSAFAHGRHRNFSFNNNDAEFGDCAANRITFDDQRAAVQKVELPAAGLRSLRVNSGNGSVSVRGGSAWAVVACKAAEDEAMLRNIDVRLSGNELTSSGPKEDDWMVFYYITAPRGADLGVDASNGPVSLSGVDGTLNVRQKNGPLSLRNTSGNVDAETVNGPISVRGGSGTIKVSATNGPLSVHLDGSGFNGTLDASTKNGPLSVRLPRGYRSGVLVEALGHGPISCKAEGCEGLRSRTRNDSWDDEPRTFEFGSGARAVHLSTVNGPVTIRESDED